MAFKVTWVGAHPQNFRVGRLGHKPKHLVIHIAQGSRAGTGKWFNDPDSEASTHYMACKNGEVDQYVLEENTAYGNGIIESSDATPYWVYEANPNLTTISIENEGNSGEPLTVEHWNTLVELCRDICNRHAIPKDRINIVGHYQIQAKNRANCPGRGIDLNKLVAAIAPAVPADFRDEYTGYYVVGAFAEYYWVNDPANRLGRPVSGMTGGIYTGVFMQDFELGMLTMPAGNTSPDKVIYTPKAA